MKTIIHSGIEYSMPQVQVLQSSGLGVSEIAARTCYDSFDTSENTPIISMNRILSEGESYEGEGAHALRLANGIDESKLLTSLAWVHHHHSILEHTTISFHISGTSRGVLQEFARHRIQAISVRSTRYTMSGIINAFIASQKDIKPKLWFIKQILKLDMFVTCDLTYASLEASHMYEKLLHQMIVLGKEEFFKIAIAKSSLEKLEQYNLALPGTVYSMLQAGKKKRNVGDAFKHIVTDNWKVDMVSTMNLRALKNFFGLRDSGAAFFLIEALAQEMKTATNPKYLDLIVKAK